MQPSMPHAATPNLLDDIASLKALIVATHNRATTHEQLESLIDAMVTARNGTACLDAVGYLGYTALTAAVSADRPLLVLLLLARGSSANQVDLLGRRPLYLAEDLKRVEIYNILLLVGGAYSTYPHPLSSNYARSNATFQRIVTDRELMKVHGKSGGFISALGDLARGEKWAISTSIPNWRARDGSTRLTRAIATGDEDVVEAVLALGDDPTFLDGEMENPAGWAEHFAYRAIDTDPDAAARRNIAERVCALHHAALARKAAHEVSAANPARFGSMGTAAASWWRGFLGREATSAASLAEDSAHQVLLSPAESVEKDLKYE